MNDTMNKPGMTNEQVAILVKLYRDGLVWSQETLAEISGLTVRTIQRVEAGEPSSLDTRRAIARAMKILDMDIFMKPWPFTTPQCAEIGEKELTIAVPGFKCIFQKMGNARHLTPVLQKQNVQIWGSKGNHLSFRNGDRIKYKFLRIHRQADLCV
jgi:transcriptional regulator with XRE-family HTH domain